MRLRNLVNFSPEPTNGDQAPPVPAGVEGDIGTTGQVLRVTPCSRLELGLWLRPGTGEVELDAVELRKIG